MTRILDRQKAVTLRKGGKSYGQIKKEIGVSKSTLSVWLRDYPLTRAQIKDLKTITEIRIEKFRTTMRLKRDARLRKCYKKQKRRLLPLTNKELMIAGLFLYWGEGSKTERHMVGINNNDPAVLQFMLIWFIKCLRVPKHKIRVYLHLYSDMDTRKEQRYWSDILNIPLLNFDKPYIKKSLKRNIDHKGFGHGTCGLRFYKTEIKDDVLMAIKSISEYYSKDINSL